MATVLNLDDLLNTEKQEEEKKKKSQGCKGGGCCGGNKQSKTAPTTCNSTQSFDILRQSADNIVKATRQYGYDFRDLTKKICDQFIVCPGKNRSKMKTIHDNNTNEVKNKNCGGCKKACCKKIKEDKKKKRKTSEGELAQMILDAMNEKYNDEGTMDAKT